MNEMMFTNKRKLEEGNQHSYISSRTWGICSHTGLNVSLNKGRMDAVLGINQTGVVLRPGAALVQVGKMLETHKDARNRHGCGGSWGKCSASGVKDGERWTFMQGLRDVG